MKWSATSRIYRVELPIIFCSYLSLRKDNLLDSESLKWMNKICVFWGSKYLLDSISLKWINFNRMSRCIYIHFTLYFVFLFPYIVFYNFGSSVFHFLFCFVLFFPLYFEIFSWAHSINQNFILNLFISSLFWYIVKRSFKYNAHFLGLTY